MKSRGKGLLFAGLGASLWGSAGVTGQVLMDTYHLPATALSVWRLILSGFLLLGFDYLLHRESLLRPWKDRADALRLFVFAVFGMMGTQYFYFRAIQYSNAPTGTILQYLMSILLIFYTAFEERRLPRGMEISCAILAMAGTFLVVTGGDWHAVKISQAALLWGLLSALAEAVYVVEPIPLMKRYRPSLLVGWGMLAGGVALIPFMDAPITAGGGFLLLTYGISSLCVIRYGSSISAVSHECGRDFPWGGGNSGGHGAAVFPSTVPAVPYDVLFRDADNRCAGHCGGSSSGIFREITYLSSQGSCIL